MAVNAAALPFVAYIHLPAADERQADDGQARQRLDLEHTVAVVTLVLALVLYTVVTIPLMITGGS